MFDRTTLAMLPSARALRVHLLRHGETVQGRARTCRGQSDVPLSEAGLTQSRRLAAWYLGHHGPPPRLWTSDLSRCADLADLLTLGTFDPVVSPRRCPELREQHMGAWEGRSWEDLSREDPEAVRARWADYLDHAPPGGESCRDLSRRVLGWWAATAAEIAALPAPADPYTPERLVIVSHAGPIRALICGWLGLPPSELLRFSPPQGSLTEILIAESGCVIERLGMDLFPDPGETG